MPQPCRQPLKQNPFESYRDPETGQWKVRYPTSVLPTAASTPPVPVSVMSAAQPLPAEAALSAAAAVSESEIERVQRIKPRHRWQKPNSPQVA